MPSEAKARRPREAPTPPPEAQGAPGPAVRAATTVWHMFADPGRLVWLLVLTSAGLLGALAVQLFGLRQGLLGLAREDRLVARLYAFFELNAPWSSWWLTLLVTVTAFAALATAVEQVGLLVVAVRRPRTDPRRTEDLPARAAVRAAAALGGTARIGVSEGGAAATAPSKRLLGGLAVLGLAGALFTASVIAERYLGLSGEMILASGATQDRVHVLSPHGDTTSRELGFQVETASVDPASSAAKLRIVREGQPVLEERLAPGEPLRLGLTRLEAREVRPSRGEERFHLVIRDQETAAETKVVLPLLGRAQMPGGPIFRVDGYETDLRGQGPAVHVEISGEGVTTEAFWLFERNPAFDEENRQRRWTVTLTHLERSWELIAAVGRHPGLLLSLAGFLALLVAGLALVLGARESRAVRIRAGRIVGVPAGDARVEAAVQAAEAP